MLFDFAGTLFVPVRAEDLVRGALRRLGAAADEDQVARLARDYLEAGIPGGPYPDLVPASVAELYERRDLSPAAHRDAYVGLLSRVRATVDGLAEAVYHETLRPTGWIPYADARDVLDRLLAAGLRVGLISNIGFDLRPIVRHHGFPELAEHCTLSYEVQAIKPSPEIFAAALRGLRAGPAETLMVGDHQRADGGAAAVGMRTLILPMSEPGTVHGLRRVLAAVGL